MKRYTVTIVSGATSGERPTLLVPFEPSAIVTAFVDELFTRVARRGLPLAPNTHLATLHIDSENGALIDIEDVLGDVVTAESEKIFAVFTQHPSTHQARLHINTDTVDVRVITAALARSKEAAPILTVPISATIKQLHELVAEHLQVRGDYTNKDDGNECNCNLSRQLADTACGPSSFLIVHGKSAVERLDLSTASEDALKAALRQRLGQYYESTKKAQFFGAEMQVENVTAYKKPPVVAICSKLRHTPAHARVLEDGEQTSQSRSHVMDLHTYEAPIHSGCMHVTIEESGLAALVTDGAIDIFPIMRATTETKNLPPRGRDSIYRAQPHWEPPTVQSDRAMAMFLSSLRVFTSVVEELEPTQKDATLHTFHLLTQHPPAVRALHVLIHGKTPTLAECAALSHGFYAVLDRIIPTALIGTDHTRVFEGTRLLCGFILEKSRALKLSEVEQGTPYLTALQELELSDCRTGEAVMYALQAEASIVERALSDALSSEGVLGDYGPRHLRVEVAEANTDICRVALLTAGSTAQLLTFSRAMLTDKYSYPDNGDADAAWDPAELSEMQHLAEMCSRNNMKLAVHKPSQLAGAVAPCLTFDRKANLAVYTGQEACSADPSKATLIFRPLSGIERIDTAVIEQLISIILKQHEADGTAIFDALGGAAVRRLQTPDELLMFVVDTSASMRDVTDFKEVIDDDILMSQPTTATELTEPQYYNRATFEEMKELLCKHESFPDMAAIVAEVDPCEYDSRTTASEIISLLRATLGHEIVRKHKEYEKNQERARINRYYRHSMQEAEKKLEALKIFYAGLQTHEEAMSEFLLFRAETLESNLPLQRWTWSLGDTIPTNQHNQILPLPAAITDLPHDLMCPISHTLMEDAVTVLADGHTYSRNALETWFEISDNSPMTGLRLNDTSTDANMATNERAAAWVSGGDLIARNNNPVNVTIQFSGPFDRFERCMSPLTSLETLYKIAFRGMKGRYTIFQLAKDNFAISTSPVRTIAQQNLMNGDLLSIRIADEADLGAGPIQRPQARGNLCLVKVFELHGDMLFAYWVRKDTVLTIGSIFWKHWRHLYAEGRAHNMEEARICWMNLEDSGDGRLSGNYVHGPENLSAYLDAQHCFGHLGEEKVYRDHTRVARSYDQPLVFKVAVTTKSQRSETKRDRKISRLDALKQIFQALINRILAYNYKTHIGLITVGTTTQLVKQLDGVIENFRRAVDTMSAKGDTALWDSLALAHDQLNDYSKKYPEAKKRIIVISDGCDTTSKSQTASGAYWLLKEAGTALDIITLGDEDNKDLMAASYLLGCFNLHPLSMEHALTMTEMEPFLSLSERPPIVPGPGAPRNQVQLAQKFKQAKYLATYTTANDENMPPRKEHPNLHDDFVLLTAATPMARRSVATSNTGNRSNLRQSRLLREVNLLSSRPSPTYDIYVSESDMSFMKAVVSGPAGSPYEGGTFVLYLHADDTYPIFAPKARFITKIKHPNVNAHGRICHSILDRDWTSDTTMTTIMDTIYGLLYQPETQDSVSTSATLAYHHDQVEYAEQVREFTAAHAKKSREEWKTELLG
ncbi:hypothetical protein LTR86_009914 [Recurvomyces mirabilis]|nr:hypothetical protein LTR86_009914 [Recurvomyces mirabilis]